jgi:hypothetical protein
MWSCSLSAQKVKTVCSVDKTLCYGGNKQMKDIYFAEHLCNCFVSSILYFLLCCIYVSFLFFAFLILEHISLSCLVSHCVYCLLTNLVRKRLLARGGGAVTRWPVKGTAWVSVLSQCPGNMTPIATVLWACHEVKTAVCCLKTPECPQELNGACVWRQSRRKTNLREACASVFFLVN